MDKKYYERRKSQMEVTLTKLQARYQATGEKKDQENFSQHLATYMNFTGKMRENEFDILSENVLKNDTDGGEVCPVCKEPLSEKDFQKEEVAVTGGTVELRLLRCPCCKFSIHIGKEEDEKKLAEAKLV